MYGVLYALTPELFPTKDRGTGNALAAAANRVFGIMVSGSRVDNSRSVLTYFLGAYHCSIRRFDDECSDIYLRRFVFDRRLHCSLAAIRL